MIHKIGEAWKIPADLLVRPYKSERAAMSCNFAHSFFGDPDARPARAGSV
jgi:hypothetical protein